MSRKLLRKIFTTVERMANKRGYRISWVPPIIMERPQAELRLSVEFAIAHLMLSKKDIYFVQIGANDGVTNDPMHKFVTTFGWHGVLVEPGPVAFERLKANYENDGNLTFVNAAISEKDGFRTLYTVRIDDGTFRGAHMYSSFKKEVILRQTRWVPDIADRIEEIQVRCISMETLLREVGAAHVDILQIDTEGYDFAILKMIDFSKFQPSIICYEHAHLSKSDMQAAAELLIGQGYRLARDNLDTLAYQPIASFGWRAPNNRANHPSSVIASEMSSAALGR